MLCGITISPLSSPSSWSHTHISWSSQKTRAPSELVMPAWGTMNLCILCPRKQHEALKVDELSCQLLLWFHFLCYWPLWLLVLQEQSIQTFGISLRVKGTTGTSGYKAHKGQILDSNPHLFVSRVLLFPLYSKSAKGNIKKSDRSTLYI